MHIEKYKQTPFGPDKVWPGQRWSNRGTKLVLLLSRKIWVDGWDWLSKHAVSVYIFYGLTQNKMTQNKMTQSMTIQSTIFLFDPTRKTFLNVLLRLSTELAQIFCYKDFAKCSPVWLTQVTFSSGLERDFGFPIYKSFAQHSC